MRRWLRRIATHLVAAAIPVLVIWVVAGFFGNRENWPQHQVLPLLQAIERGEVGMGADREELFVSGLLRKTVWSSRGSGGYGVGFERQVSSSQDASGSGFLIDLYFEDGKLFAAAAIRGYDDERWYFCDHDAMRRFVESRAFEVGE